MARECCGGRHSRPATKVAEDSHRKFIPAEDIGDYEEYTNGSSGRNKRPSRGGLFPLDEEGSYGAAPRPLPRPLPAYQKRDRKPKAYASYALSNDCSMHAEKLEKNETRGKTPPKRKDSFPRKDSIPRKDSLPHRDSVPRKDSFPRKDSVPRKDSLPWKDSLPRNKPQTPTISRDSGYASRPARWQDSLRGRDSSSPVTSTPLANRRPPSTLPRQPPRAASASLSPNRSRTISASPDRMRRQSISPERGRGGGSTDWGYTDFSTFRARNSISKPISGTSPPARKVSNTLQRSSISARSEDNSSFRKKSSFSAERSYSSAANNSSYSSAAANSSYASAGRSSYSGGGDFSRDKSSSRSSSPSKIALSALKTPTITEWDQMGILGLSSKMFKESTNHKESYLSSSSTTTTASYMRKESFSTKVM